MRNFKLCRKYTYTQKKFPYYLPLKMSLYSLSIISKYTIVYMNNIHLLNMKK